MLGPGFFINSYCKLNCVYDFDRKTNQLRIKVIMQVVHNPEKTLLSSMPLIISEKFHFFVVVLSPSIMEKELGCWTIGRDQVPAYELASKSLRRLKRLCVLVDVLKIIHVETYNEHLKTVHQPSRRHNSGNLGHRSTCKKLFNVSSEHEKGRYKASQ